MIYQVKNNQSYKKRVYLILEKRNLFEQNELNILNNKKIFLTFKINLCQNQKYDELRID
jgi:hypothetical protein